MIDDIKKEIDNSTSSFVGENAEYIDYDRVVEILDKYKDIEKEVVRGLEHIDNKTEDINAKIKALEFSLKSKINTIEKLQNYKNAWEELKKHYATESISLYYELIKGLEQKYNISKEME